MNYDECLEIVQSNQERKDLLRWCKCDASQIETWRKDDTSRPFFLCFCSLDSHLIKQYAKCKSHESHANSLQSGPGLEGRDMQLRGEDGTTHSFLHRTVPFFFAELCVGYPKLRSCPTFCFLISPSFPAALHLSCFGNPVFAMFWIAANNSGIFESHLHVPLSFFFLLFIFKSSKQFPISNIRLITSVWFLCSVLFRRSPRLWPTQLGSTTGRVPDICISVWQPQSFPHSYIYRRTTGTHKRSCWSVVLFFLSPQQRREREVRAGYVRSTPHSLQLPSPPPPFF